jgi:hypothetical protein
VLRIGLTEPYVRLSTTLHGPERTTETQQARSTPPRFTAYAHLILEMLNSNPMLFIRGDEAEEGGCPGPSGLWILIGSSPERTGSRGREIPEIHS